MYYCIEDSHKRYQDDAPTLIFTYFLSDPELLYDRRFPSIRNSVRPSVGHTIGIGLERQGTYQDHFAWVSARPDYES